MSDLESAAATPGLGPATAQAPNAPRANAVTFDLPPPPQSSRQSLGSSNGTTTIRTTDTTTASGSSSLNNATTPDSNNDNNDNIQNNHVQATVLPQAMRNIAQNLADLVDDDLSDEQRAAILFIIRLGDAMHQAGYATFLTASYVQELATAFHVPGLTVDLEVKALRWSYRGGGASSAHNNDNNELSGNNASLEAVHRVAPDFDGDTIFELGIVARAAAKQNITATQGLGMIAKCTGETAEQARPAWVRFYRTFPGRIILVPFLSAAAAPLFFEGTMLDSAVGIISGLAVGTIIYAANVTLPEIADIHEGLLSAVVSMIAAATYTLAPNHSCFTGHVLASLIWVFYGVSFTIALYEMTVGGGALLLTGTARFVASVLNSFIIAMGTVVGVWIAGIYAGPDRFTDVLNQDCSILEGKFPDFWLLVFYLILCISISCIMRISPRHWPICLFVFLVGMGSTFFLDEIMEQPSMVVNIVPVYLSTLAAHYGIVLFHRFHMSELKITKAAYRIVQFPHIPLPNKKDKVEDDMNPTTIDATRITTENIGAASTTGLHRRSTMRRQLATREIQFADEGWNRSFANGFGPGAGGGYIRNTKNQYQHADLWFCLMPTIYALVPGSSVWRAAFFSIMSSTWRNDYSDEENINNSADSLVAGVLLVGMSQVIGIRLGITTLALIDKIFARGCRSKQEKEDTNEIDASNQDFI